ncbi:MAG TPA: siderophore-interacting protein [Acidimicrobiia bacterium]|nr:siderophore-interacting protein [Acidimicrobiia bacterium]
MSDADSLPAPAALSLEVVGTVRVTPRMTRVRLTGDDLTGFQFVAGQDLMFAVPNGAATMNRRYTIRGFDPVARVVDVDAVLHGDGPGASWMARATPGDRIDAVGPRGKIVPSTDAEWHLFLGDESGLPAIAVMLEALPADATAVALVEVADAGEEQPIDTAAAVSLGWIHRAGAQPGDPELLVDALRSIVLPPGAGHAYLAAERGVVNALRGELATRGFEPERVASKAYWKRHEANAAHGEPFPDRP